MRRNAILAGFLTLLLGIVAFQWAAPSVANGRPAATAPAAIKRAAVSTRKILVPSSRKKRRVPLAAAAAPLPAPAVTTIHAAVDQPTISDSHKKLATAVLQALPAGCRDHLKTFVVLYKGATRRGLGGKTTVILDGSVPDAEFAALLVHECGHVINGNLLGNAQSGDSGYRDGSEVFYNDSPAVSFWSISWKPTGAKKPGMKDADFVSGYAKSDQYEDFAETFAAYVLQREMLVERAAENPTIAAKLTWMETHLPLKDDAIGPGSHDWNGTVPWDVTKLAFALSAR